MHKDRGADAIVHLLPEWPSGVFHGIRQVLNREPARKLRRLHKIVKATPPPGNFPVGQAHVLLAQLGLKTKH